MLSSSFRCYQIHKSQRYYLGHTLLRYLDIEQTNIRGWFIEYKLVLSSTFRCHQIHHCQIVTKFVAMIVTNLITLRTTAQLELLYNKLASEVSLLNTKSDLSSTTNSDQTYSHDCYEFDQS